MTARWLIVFGLIALLVLGGLGWASREALRLESQQRLSAEHLRRVEAHQRERTERADALRLALWRLDSRLAPAFAREDSRPYEHYTSMYAPFPALCGDGTARLPGDVFVPSPLMSADLPEWMRLHFALDPQRGWQSPQVVADELVRILQKQPVELALPNVTVERRDLLEALKKRFPVRPLMGTFLGNNIRVDDNPANNALGNGRAEHVPQQVVADKLLNPTLVPFEEYLRRSRGNTTRINEGQQGSKFDGRNYDNSSFPFPQKAQPLSVQPIDVEVGPLQPLWLPDAAHPDTLLLVRAIRVGTRPTWQGIVLDPDRLCVLLRDEIADLFPAARLLPRAPADVPANGLAMTVLPLTIDPGVADLPETPEPVDADALPSPGWSPLRLGLAVAWLATGLGLVAVALGGASLIRLSERRIRFVWAVTHELRTPLTSLQLYLDMLTSGLVTDEAKKTEYLHTLHGESNRLHRLIGNVLDFAGLERHRPKVSLAPVAVADLLESVRGSWVDCCAGSGKTLATESALPPGTTLSTDPGLVEQILGNLIDNARKYSAEAFDPRIVVRATASGESIRLEVEDSGPGVSAKDSRSIFRAFRRGSGADETAGGIGLGLALATRWALALGGRLSLEAATGGRGARFVLTLPR